MPLAHDGSPVQEFSMTKDNLVLYLIIFTFGLAIALGAYQWFRASKARREHHHSVQERKEGTDQRTIHAATGNVNDRPPRKEFS